MFAGVTLRRQSERELLATKGGLRPPVTPRVGLNPCLFNIPSGDWMKSEDSSPEPQVNFTQVENTALDPSWKAAYASAVVESQGSLAGRHVAVTRALSTIGRTQASVLTGAGARVSLLDLPTLRADGQELMRDLPSTRFFGVDFNVMADTKRVAAQLAADDPVDVLINNMAPDVKLPLRQLSVDDFEHADSCQLHGGLCHGARNRRGHEAARSRQHRQSVRVNA
jgi:hypothetical protein